MYMTCWLLEKLFGTINYYAFNRSLTKKEKMRFLRTIENDAVYQPLVYRKLMSNCFVKKKDKLKYIFLKMFGIRAYRFFYHLVKG